LENLENKSFESVKAPHFKFIKKFKEKSAKSMNRINNKIKGFKNKLKKKFNDKEIDSLSVPDFGSDKDYLESDIDTFEDDEKEREAFERLKIYIEELAAEQEKGD